MRLFKKSIKEKQIMVKPNQHYFKTIDVKAYGKARLVLINDVSATATPLRF